MAPTAADQTKQAILAAGCLMPGHFVFAAGHYAIQKLELDNLWEHPAELRIVLSHLTTASGLPPTDAILGVPTGGQRLAEALAQPGYAGLPLIRLERIPGGAKQDFRFASAADAVLAHVSQRLRIYEDVVTTLSSIAGVVRLLDPTRQTIHSLTLWRRGEVHARYRHGVTDHYLVEELLPSYAPADCPDPSCHSQTTQAA